MIDLMNQYWSITNLKLITIPSSRNTLKQNHHSHDNEAATSFTVLDVTSLKE